MTSTVLTPPPREALAQHQAHFPPVEVALEGGLGSGQQGDAVVPFSPSCMHSALTSSWSQRDAKRAVSAECQIPNPRERKANPRSPGRHIPLFTTVPALTLHIPYLGETDEIHPRSQALLQGFHSFFSTSSSLLLYTYKCISIFIFSLIHVNTNVMWR